MLSALSSPATAHNYSLSARDRHHHELSSKAKHSMQIRSSAPIHEATKRKPKQSPCPQLACNKLIVNHNTIDYKLRSIANCLVHLSRPYREIALGRKNSQHNDWNKIEVDSSLDCTNDQREAAAAAVRDEFRIRKMVRIYSMLIKLSPIEAHLRFGAPTATSNGNLVKLFDEKKFCPLEARQRVLDLIEHQLNGYCDSIHLLRCILRSSTMIGVIAAFSEIIKKTLAYNCSKLHDDLEDSEIEVASGKFEFRIVQEWKL